MNRKVCGGGRSTRQSLAQARTRQSLARASLARAGYGSVTIILNTCEAATIIYLCTKLKSMTASLNNAQLEILKLFAADLSEDELQDLRRMLIDFRYHRLQHAVDKLNPSKEQIEVWGKGHDRTAYKSQDAKNQSSS